MKKGLLILLLLVTVVCAQEPIPRYSDFPLDNIHILRLQGASEAIAQNVSALEHMITDFKQVQTTELQSIRKTMDDFKQIQSMQLMNMQEQVTAISNNIGAPRTEIPQARFPPILITLLSVNV